MTERRAVYNASPLEDEFALQLRIAGIPFEREYRAINGRKYRWDFLVGSILVEIQGGTWTKGGHSTGKGLHRDYEKNNAAVLAGWRVLYFDGEMVRSGAALGTVQSYLELNGEFPRLTLAEALVQSGVFEKIKQACDEFLAASQSDKIEQEADSQDVQTVRVQPWVKKACEVAESKIEIEADMQEEDE